MTKQLTKIDPERWAQPIGSQEDLRGFLAMAAGSIKAALPRHLTPERMIRVAMTAATRQPKLLSCTAASMIAAIIQASQLGLECDGILGQAYLVPFKCKIKDAEGKEHWAVQAQLIPGYKGLIKLARNSGELMTIQDHCVFEGDEFEYSLGLAPKLVHVPKDKTRKITHAWATATLKNGAIQFEVMTLAEIEKIRSRSKSADEGPWISDFEMMCRKTVTKRLCRLLPLSVELATALDLDDQASVGRLQHMASAALLPQEARAALPNLESDGEEVELDGATQAQRLTNKLKSKKATQESEAAALPA